MMLGKEIEEKLEKEYFMGKWETKCARFHAEYQKEKRRLNKKQKLVGWILWTLIEIDFILMAFVRFCEMRFGASCLKMFLLEVIITVPVTFLYFYIVAKKERRLRSIEKKIVHYMDKLDAIA